MKNFLNLKETKIIRTSIITFIALFCFQNAHAYASENPITNVFNSKEEFSCELVRDLFLLTRRTFPKSGAPVRLYLLKNQHDNLEFFKKYIKIPVNEYEKIISSEISMGNIIPPKRLNNSEEQYREIQSDIKGLGYGTNNTNGVFIIYLDECL